MSDASQSSETNKGIEQRFLASVSHEIRTPLNGILGMASLLAETELTAAQSDYVTAIRQSGARLLDLLNNVLDYARMDAAGIELEPSAVNLVKLSQDVIELLSPRAHERGLDLCIRAADDLPEVCMLDDGRMRQILFNLVGNAIKFTETGGVLLDLATHEDGLLIRVYDSGPGLSAADQEKLFKAFSQTDTSHRGKDGGVGLGLTIVRRLLSAMSGDIRVISEPGYGACFEIRIPTQLERTPATAKDKSVSPGLKIGLQGLSAPLQISLASMLLQGGHNAFIDADPSRMDLLIVDASCAPSEIRKLSEAAPVITLIRPEDRAHIEQLRALGTSAYLMRPIRRSSLFEQLHAQKNQIVTQDMSHADEAIKPPRHGRVLIADDNAVNALLATRTLEKAGYTCLSAATGAEAVEAIELSDFDIVLMDLRMPVMDGFEAMRRVRALTTEKNSLPIIAISAEINPDVEREAKAAGANAVAAKPLDPHTLRSIVERWIDRQKAEA